MIHGYVDSYLLLAQISGKTEQNEKWLAEKAQSCFPSLDLMDNTFISNKMCRIEAV